MSYNVPDDWGMYYSRCSECGVKTHASEGYACKCDYEDVVKPIATKFKVCSKTADIKVISLFKNEHGGIYEETQLWPADDWHIDRYLTANQVKYRNQLLKRLNK